MYFIRFHVRYIGEIVNCRIIQNDKHSVRSRSCLSRQMAGTWVFFIGLSIKIYCFCDLCRITFKTRRISNNVTRPHDKLLFSCPQLYIIARRVDLIAKHDASQINGILLVRCLFTLLEIDVQYKNKSKYVK